MEGKYKKTNALIWKIVLIGLCFSLLILVIFFVRGQKNTIGNAAKEIDKKKYQVKIGKVVVFDVYKNKEIGSVDISAKEENFNIEFNPHDIEIAPDKKSVWVSATASENQLNLLRKDLEQKSEGDRHIMTATDQIIVIDTTTDKIQKKIPIGVSLSLADLVISPDGKYVYVASEAGNAIYKVNMNTYKVDLIQMPPESKPHQLALSIDGTKLYTRNSVDNNTFLISTKTNEIKNIKDEDARNLNWSMH